MKMTPTRKAWTDQQGLFHVEDLEDGITVTYGSLEDFQRELEYFRAVYAVT